MTAHIPAPTDLAFRLLDELSRARALADDESLLLEMIVNRGHQCTGIRFQWSPDLERELWKASYRKGAIRQFAAKHGITEMQAYKRIEKLRARKGKSPSTGGKG